MEMNNAESSRENSAGSTTSLDLEPWKQQQQLRGLANPDNSVPLSPQWLFSKPAESKPSVVSRDPQHTAAAPGDGLSKQQWRSVADGGAQDVKRNKDSWRTMPAEADANRYRHKRWQEEERENIIHLPPRNDRWTDGGRYTTSNPATSQLQEDRQGENVQGSDINKSVLAPGREPGEPLLRPFASDRGINSNNREATFDNRRDSKWSSSWNPEERKKEFRWPRESKLVSDGPDKGVVNSGGYQPQHPTSTRIAKEFDRERERDRLQNSGPRGDHAWRPQFVASRGRGDALVVGSTPPRGAPGFNALRSRGDGSGLGFAVICGRASFMGSSVVSHGSAVPSSAGAPPLIDTSDPDEGRVGRNLSVYHYSRMKVLEVYWKCGSLPSVGNCPDGLSNVQHLMQDDALEPLAFSRPGVGEEAVLEGIRNGDIVSSGAMHSIGPKEANAKEANANRELSRYADAEAEAWESSACSEVTSDADGGSRGQLGEEWSGDSGMEDSTWRREGSGQSDGIWCKPKGGNEAVSNPKKVKRWRDDRSIEKDDRSSWRCKEVLLPERGRWMQNDKIKSRQLKEGNLTERRNPSQSLPDVGTGNQDRGLSLSPQSKSHVITSVAPVGAEAGKPNCQPSEWNGATKAAAAPQRAPEELSIFYKDPQGDVQGPFMGVDIIDWFEAGFFNTELPVRLADSLEGTSFVPLGQVMPHLRPKPRPPPGFVSLKKSEEIDKAALANGDGECLSHSGQQAALEQRQRSGGVVGKDLEVNLLPRLETLRLVDATEATFGGDSRFSSKQTLCTEMEEMPADNLFGLSEGASTAKTDKLVDQDFPMQRQMSTLSCAEMDVSDPAKHSLPKICSQSLQSQECEELKTSLVGTIEALGPTTVHGLPSAAQSSSWQSQSGLVQAMQSGLSVQGLFSKLDQPLPDNLAYKVPPNAAHSHVEPPTHGGVVHPNHLQQQLELLELQHYLQSRHLHPSLQGLPPQHQSEYLKLPFSSPLQQQHGTSFARPDLEQLLRPGLFNHHHPLLQPPPSTAGTVFGELLQMQQHQQQQLLPQVPTGELAWYQPILTASPSLHLHRHPSDSGPRVGGLFEQPPVVQQHAEALWMGSPGHPQNPQGVRSVEQLFQAQGSHPRLAAFNHILRQEQQQEQLGLPWQSANTDEMRIPGVWEVNESDQFVPRKAPSAVPASTGTHQPQLQLPQQRVHHQSPEQLQSNLSGVFQLDVPHVEQGGEVDNLVNVFDPSILQLEQNMPVISLSSTESGTMLPAKSVSGIQGLQYHAQAERHNNIPAFTEEQVHEEAVQMHQEQNVLEQKASSWNEAVSLPPKVLGSSLVKDNDMQSSWHLTDKPLLPLTSCQGSRDHPLEKTKEYVHDLSHDSWGRETRNYGGPDEQPQERADGRSLGFSHVEEIPVKCTSIISLETPQPSAAVTPPEPLKFPDSWSPSQQPADLILHQEPGSILSSPVWRLALPPECKSVMEIQQEQAEHQRLEEQGVAEVDACTMPLQESVVSSGMSGPWVASVCPPQVKKSLKEIQEEKACRALGVGTSPGHTMSYPATTVSSEIINKSGICSTIPPSLMGEEGRLLCNATEDLCGNGANKNLLDNLSSQTSEAAAIQTSVQTTPDLDSTNFVEPKESRKKKKRASKSKGATAASKSSTPERASSPKPASSKKSSSVLPIAQLDAPKESKRAPPPGPLLADFLNLRDEPESSLPAPAWSVDPSQGKAAKSFKEIQEAESHNLEQERQAQMMHALAGQQQRLSTPSKSSTIMTRTSSGAGAWSLPSGSPSISPSPLVSQQSLGSRFPATAANKSSGSNNGPSEDDAELFWNYGESLKTKSGAIKQSPIIERSEIPSVNLSKGSIVRGAQPKVVPSLVPIAQQAATHNVTHQVSPSEFPSLHASTITNTAKANTTKSIQQQDTRPFEGSSASPGVQWGAVTSLEAKALHQWCQSQIKKLSGVDDTAIIDYCISIPSSGEAGTYLSQYLLTLPGISKSHVELFKTEFIRRKEQLATGPSGIPLSSSDDADALFGSNGRMERSKGSADSNPGKVDDALGGSDKGANKKGKKGKKVVDPSLLGFSITSNRIMMGEIQHIDN